MSTMHAKLLQTYRETRTGGGYTLPAFVSRDFTMQAIELARYWQSYLCLPVNTPNSEHVYHLGIELQERMAVQYRAEWMCWLFDSMCGHFNAEGRLERLNVLAPVVQAEEEALP